MTKLYDELKELAEKLAGENSEQDRQFLRLVIRDKLEDNLPAILSALKNQEDAEHWRHNHDEQVRRKQFVQKILKKAIDKLRGDEMAFNLFSDEIAELAEWRDYTEDDAAIDAAQSQEDRHGGDENSA